jgi:hypothetical protein
MSVTWAWRCVGDNTGKLVNSPEPQSADLLEKKLLISRGRSSQGKLGVLVNNVTSLESRLYSSYGCAPINFSVANVRHMYGG